MAFLSSLNNFFIRCIGYFSKSCWLFWDRAQNIPIFGRRGSTPLTASWRHRHNFAGQDALILQSATLWHLPGHHNLKLKNSDKVCTPVLWHIEFGVYSFRTTWFPDGLYNAAFRLACRSALCHVIIACCFRVAALSSLAALALSPSGIAPKLNRIQLSAICRGGQSGKVIDLLACCCLPLGHPSAASGACAVEQISSSKRQCGKRQASLKPA